MMIDLETTTNKDVLIAARDWLKGRGHWMKGYYGDWTYSGLIGTTCAVGSLVYVLTDGESFDPDLLDSDQVVFYGEALTALAKCARGLGDVTVFNDDPSTRKKDVIALFNCAIENA
jgi:hypothetical protein